MNIEKWLKNNTKDLSNKTIALTGSTGDILNESVKILAELNANLILINRNEEKSKRQIRELQTLNPNINIEFIKCDLVDFSNVKKTVEILKHKHIDILILSAGIYNTKQYITELNFNNIFQINFLSQYYIAKELLNQIKSREGKIIGVSSIAYNYSKINEKDVDFSHVKKQSKVYGNAKRFFTFSLMELCKKEQVNLSIVHPGLTLTEMTNHYHKSINWLVRLVIGSICPNKKQASLNLMKGIFDSTNYHEWIGPKIFNIWGKPTKKKIKISKQESEKIFEISEKFYKKIK